MREVTVSTVLVGIDIGTSSSKGVLVTPDGTVLRQFARRHAVSRPEPGRAEQDAVEVWWSDVVALCQLLLSDGEFEIAGVGISGLGPCMLPVDRHGRALRPAILYAIDTRAMSQVRQINNRFGADLLKRCGHPATSQSVGPKVLWLAENEPEVFRNTARVFSSTNFIVQRLTGAYVIDHLTASTFDPLYDIHAGTWIEDWAQELLPHITLPELCWPGDVVGRVSKRAAAETGLPAGVPVVCGTMDFWAENVSVDAERPGDCMLAYGTTMSVSAVVAQPAIDPALGTTPASGPGVFHVGGATAAAGGLTDWVRQLTGEQEFEPLLKLAAGVQPGSDGVLILPYFAGERAPIFDAQARGVISGLTLHHGAGELYRAALESTGYAIRHIFDALDREGVDRRRLMAAGGGTRGELWMQVVSDITGSEQQVPRERAGASYGAALLAGRGIGLVAGDTHWNTTVDVVTPDPRNRERYDELYTLYRRLDGATREISHALGAVTLPTVHPRSEDGIA